MKDYLDFVKDSAKNKINKRFANSSLEHARLLTEELIMSAEKEVLILTDKFTDKFYSSVTPTIKKFLKKDYTILKIITICENSKMLEELKNEFSDKILIKEVDSNFLPKDKQSNEVINYLINDTNGFRYEYSDKNIDKGIVEAIANFNSKKETEQLRNHFNELFK